MSLCWAGLGGLLCREPALRNAARARGEPALSTGPHLPLSPTVWTYCRFLEFPFDVYLPPVILFGGICWSDGWKNTAWNRAAEGRENVRNRIKIIFYKRLSLAE